MKKVNSFKSFINIGILRSFFTLSLLVFFVLFSKAQSVIPGEGEDKDWNFVVAPYIWFGGFNGMVQAGPLEAEVDADFSDIFENLDMGFMLYGEARYQKYGFAIDWLTLNMGLEGMTPITERTLEVDPKITFLETSFLYNVHHSEKWSADAYLGIRTWWVKNQLVLDQTISGEPKMRESSSSWNDFIIGAKGTFLPHEKWPITAKVDVGGFGSNSRFSWNAQLGVGYRFAKTWTVLLQYRGMGIDYEVGENGTPAYFTMDANLYGPLLGVMATF